MNTIEKTTVTVETTVKAPVEKVWTSWTEPQHITKWCQASPDWHAPYADNDVRVGGTFKTTMAAKDGSFSFERDDQSVRILFIEPPASPPEVRVSGFRVDFERADEAKK